MVTEVSVLISLGSRKQLQRCRRAKEYS